MTVRWTQYAKSLTSRPMKGMLTGPITILQWSFVRDDQPRRDTAFQIALAVRDEVADLEAAGIGVIQIDEPALREGLPLRRAAWADYLKWAVDAFRLASTGVRDETQIHTHMCYSEFNDIIESIAALDADVISIEASRSDMELLGAFVKFKYPNEIGPGVYDIHSPRVPETEEIMGRLQKALRAIPADMLWVNPDCGLKTRGWPEVHASLRNMVEAAKSLRRTMGRVFLTASARLRLRIACTPRIRGGIMDTALVIHGKIAEKQFISDEPMPDVEGPAELIVYPKDTPQKRQAGTSIFDLFGKARASAVRRGY